jgi:predicted acyl esterase
MRDGVRLFTSVYMPKDTSQSYPILMLRRPYSVAPYGEGAYRDNLGPSAAFVDEKYIFVYQDVRGRFMSEGNFKWMTPYKLYKSHPADVDESTDTYDTIEWLLRNIPDNNGRVGMWGISFPGHYTAQPGEHTGGYQMLVRGEPMRAKYRNSWSKPEPMPPNTPTKLAWEMPDINHTFLKGHRIMLQIQSSWFPLVDRNPQKFVNIYQATEADFQKTIQRVYFGSRMTLRRVP